MLCLLRKLECAHSDIFYHEDHEGREDKEQFFVFFVVINNNRQSTELVNCYRRSLKNAEK